MDHSCILKYSLKHTHTPTHNMVSPLSYFLFQSVLHKLYNKSRGMYVLFCLWDSAHKRYLADNQTELPVK